MSRRSPYRSKIYSKFYILKNTYTKKKPNSATLQCAERCSNLVSVVLRKRLNHERGKSSFLLALKQFTDLITMASFLSPAINNVIYVSFSYNFTTVLHSRITLAIEYLEPSCTNFNLNLSKE